MAGPPSPSTKSSSIMPRFLSVVGIVVVLALFIVLILCVTGVLQQNDKDKK